MAGLGANVLTLADWAKRVDPDGTVPQIVELMSETNEILQDALFVEGNLPTGHRTTVRTGLPSVVWRKLNYGVQPSKSTTRQVDDTCGMCEAYSKVDVDLMRLNGNDPGFRLSEELPFLEAMNQEMAGGLFYFDTDTEPEKFLGLANRYPTLSTSNVVTASGTGSDLTSMWLVVWGPNTVHCIFPKGSKAGLQQQDLGVKVVEDDQTPAGIYQAYMTHWKWDVGLCVRDWRYVVRICNIKSTGTSNIIDPDLMIDAVAKLPSIRSVGGGRAVWYCNKTVWAQLCKLAMDKSNASLSWGEIFGKRVLMFWDIPIRQVDQLLITESALV